MISGHAELLDVLWRPTVVTDRTLHRYKDETGAGDSDRARVWIVLSGWAQGAEPELSTNAGHDFARPHTTQPHDPAMSSMASWASAL